MHSHENIYSTKRLESAQLLGQLGVFLTWSGKRSAPLQSETHDVELCRVRLCRAEVVCTRKPDCSIMPFMVG
jgi:hypothetical protein